VRYGGDVPLKLLGAGSGHPIGDDLATLISVVYLTRELAMISVADTEQDGTSQDTRGL
jgi:hypothetical protein